MKRRNGNDREDHPADPEPPAAPEPGPDEEKGLSGVDAPPVAPLWSAVGLPAMCQPS